MPASIPDSQLRDLLRDLKSIAVIGLSPIPARPSYGVTRYMIAAGYEIYGVRPASPALILGQPAVEKLSDLQADIEILNVFRNSDALLELVDEIGKWMKAKPVGAVQPKLLWLQEGVSNAEAEKKAQALGLLVISDRCILKEHARLL